METQQSNGGLFTVFVLVLFALVAMFATGCTGPRGDTGEPGKTVVGPPGRDGADGQDCFTEIIDPCGDGPGVDEVLIRMCSNDVIAWYLGIGLVEITTGVWQTTDAQACRFEIFMDGSVSW